MTASVLLAHLHIFLVSYQCFAITDLQESCWRRCNIIRKANWIETTLCLGHMRIFKPFKLGWLWVEISDAQVSNYLVMKRAK